MARIARPNPEQSRVIRRTPLRKARRLPALAYCGICGSPIYTDSTSGGPLSLCFDHTWSKARYPQLRNQVWNLQPAHKICNERKGDRDPTPEEARRALARREAAPAPQLSAKRRRAPTARRLTPAANRSCLGETLRRI